MPPRSRFSSQVLRKFDAKLKLHAPKIHREVMELLLVAYPLEVRSTVSGLLRARKTDDLLQWADSFGSAMHATAQETFRASQLSAMLKKYPYEDTSTAQKAREVAVRKFDDAEKRCQRYNLRFRRVFAPSFRNLPIDKMRRWIQYVLGETPDLTKIYSGCSFGPGASVGVHGNSTSMLRKYLAEKWTCTPAALPFAVSALAQDQHVWELILPSRNGHFCLDIEDFRKEVQDRVRLVQHNKIAFVPKTALVDRTIAIEPLLNGYLQKGVDLFMRQRLKRVGIDLTDQTVNQRLAREGSYPDQSDPFITIDLSSASDSISSEVVRKLLPPDWFNFLNHIRSPMYELDGVERRYHKFVSMGNGFCFPLETLIFASVCQACQVSGTDRSFIVYGDDIIVRRSVGRKVLTILKALGFRHNPKKTFFEGPFRESCGADWYEGRDIRPLGLDYRFDCLRNIIKFYNLSLSKPLWADYFSEVRDYLWEMVPEELRLCRPYKGNVDGAFEVPLDKFQSSPFAYWDRDIQAWGWKELAYRPVADKWQGDSVSRYCTVLAMASVRGFPSRKTFSYRRKTTQTICRKAYAGADATWLPPPIE